MKKVQISATEMIVISIVVIVLILVILFIVGIKEKGFTLVQTINNSIGEGMI